jgi:RNA polymerase sigma-70 factor (ECF subfamily)
LTRFVGWRNLGSVGLEDRDLAELARGSVAGDARATRSLLIAVGPSMMRAVGKVLARRTADAEDVLQEAMQALVEALPRFRGECTVAHFACRVAVLTALVNRRRLDVRAHWAVDIEQTDEPASPQPSPADEMFLQGRRRAEVLMLHAMLGFTIEEVAAAVRRPAETVRSRLRLGKQAMRDRILSSPALSELMKVGT